LAHAQGQFRIVALAIGVIDLGDVHGVVALISDDVQE
jgi:hypothetical protein